MLVLLRLSAAVLRAASAAPMTSPPGRRLLSVFDRVNERRWRFSMDVGIGLPNAVPDTEGRTLVDWARRADEAGFSTLGTIGRLVYPNYEELIGLAAASAVTSRIRLTTSVLLAPLHTNTAMFAQAAAAVDQAWQDEGRPGKPRKLSLAYFALGPDARALADGYLGQYYAFLGDIAGQIAASAAVSAEMVQGYAAAFAEAGCD